MPNPVSRDLVLASTRVGEMIDGRWRLVARLGVGGMGEVYRAEHVSLGRVVAIKLLRPELASSAMYARRVLHEGRAATLVIHPNIVRIEDVGIDERGSPYLVQEFLDGIDLATYAQYRRGPVPARDLIPLMLPVLDALAVLHSAGVVHRDLKPENIFLVRDGVGWSPRLMDFGLAVIAEHLEDNRRITGSDVTLGSPAYMSPEQFCDPRHLTARSDVWSLGVMFYELLSGALPFQGASVGAMAIAVSNELPIPLQRRLPGLSFSLAAVVMSCLEKDPNRRPANVRVLMEVLRVVYSTLPAPISEEDLTPTERRTALAVSPGPEIGPVHVPSSAPGSHARSSTAAGSTRHRSWATPLFAAMVLAAVVFAWMRWRH
jgi:eukaryotic-like serine/threonine-protein kinase